MTQPIKPKLAPVKAAITMQDICDYFSISPRYARDLIRRGVIDAKPKRFRKRPKSDERRAVDWIITRAEWNRLITYGLVPKNELEGSK